jgi:hypothetical protein
MKNTNNALDDALKMPSQWASSRSAKTELQFLDYARGSIGSAWSPETFLHPLQLITRAAPARRCFLQQALREQIVDVPQRCIRRAFGNGRPFAAG